VHKNNTGGQFDDANSSGDAGNVDEITSDDFVLRFCLLIYFGIIFRTSNSSST